MITNLITGLVINRCDRGGERSIDPMITENDYSEVGDTLKVIWLKSSPNQALSRVQFIAHPRFWGEDLEHDFVISHWARGSRESCNQPRFDRSGRNHPERTAILDRSG
jgi:hypothetical protein